MTSLIHPDLEGEVNELAAPVIEGEVRMRWRLEFYSERRAIVASYEVEAPTPAAAVLVGREAVLAEHPPVPSRRRLSLFARAQRVGGEDASGWVLYRIVKA